MKIINGWHLPELDSLISKQARHHTHPDTDYQQEVLDAALVLVRNWRLALDIGGNVGLHTVRLAQKFDKVIAFEPSSINYECLQANTQQFANIELRQQALGEQPTTLCLELPEGMANCGAFSFKDFQNLSVAKHQEMVTVIPLDDLDLAPDMIKIDTQGFERQVLMGARRTLAQYQPVIIVEVAKKGPVAELMEILAPLNYEIAYVTNKDKVFAVKK